MGIRANTILEKKLLNIQDAKIKILKNNKTSMKYFFIIFILFVFSCNKLNKEKIIYNINKEINDSLLSIYQKKFKDRNVVIIMDSFKKNKNNKLKITVRDEKFIKEILKNNNRYLKINDSLILPVLFYPDLFFYQNSEGELLNSLGGSTNIYINEKDEVIKIFYEY